MDNVSLAVIFRDHLHRLTRENRVVIGDVPRVGALTLRRDLAEAVATMLETFHAEPFAADGSAVSLGFELIDRHSIIVEARVQRATDKPTDQEEGQRRFNEIKTIAGQVNGSLSLRVEGRICRYSLTATLAPS